MSGLAFSGKSTLAKKIAERTGATLLSFDSMWVETEKLGPIPQGAEGWRYIRNAAKEKIQDLLKAGTSVVYDETNVRKEHRDELMDVAKSAGVRGVIVYMDTPLDVIRKREEENRISQGRHEVDPKLFEEVLSQLEVPTADEGAVFVRPEESAEEAAERLVGKID